MHLWCGEVERDVFDVQGYQMKYSNGISVPLREGLLRFYVFWFFLLSSTFYKSKVLNYTKLYFFTFKVAIFVPVHKAWWLVACCLAVSPLCSPPRGCVLVTFCPEVAFLFKCALSQKLLAGVLRTLVQTFILCMSCNNVYILSSTTIWFILICLWFIQNHTKLRTFTLASPFVFVVMCHTCTLN